MRFKSIAAGMVVLILSLNITFPVKACIVFTSEGKGTVLAGSNEDWMYSYSTYMTITAPKEQSYGRVCLYTSSYVQAGMNEYGLFYDGASCPSSVVPYDDTKETLGYDLGEVVLSECASVNEVIEMLKNYNIPGGFNDHFLFADATGDSVVLEWMEGELHIIPKEENNYQLITNYWLTEPSLGNYPCSRFDIAEEFLKEEEPSVELFTGILKATKQDWGGGGTIYSGVYDLIKRTVYVFSEGEMDAACEVNLIQQLDSMEAGQQITQPIEELAFDKYITATNLQGEEQKDTIQEDQQEDKQEDNQEDQQEDNQEDQKADQQVDQQEEQQEDQQEDKVTDSNSSEARSEYNENSGWFWLLGFIILSGVVFVIYKLVVVKNN